MINFPDHVKNIMLADNVSDATKRKICLKFHDETSETLYPYETLFPEDSLFPSEKGEPWLVIRNDRIEQESLSITESLSSSENLEFGSCESTSLEITVADVEMDLTGKEFVLTMEVGGYEFEMGLYTIESFVRDSNRRKRKITAYDRMRRFDTDVSGWYNDLSFPMTIRKFRKSLCEYIGVSEEQADLVLDDMEITKTIEPEQLSGLDVLKAICQINGCFGHISRTGQLKYIHLQQTGLYPSDDLFPDEDLFPSENGGDGVAFETITSYKQPMTYEDYMVDGISGLQIREQEGDVGASVGSGDNVYIIEGNFLAYGKSATELLSIAQSILPIIHGRTYRPCTVSCRSRPWVEIGDLLVIPTNDDVVETFCIKRQLSGIQATVDTYTSTGSKNREEIFGVEKQIIQLEGKSAVIAKSVEEVSVKVTDLKNYTDAQFKITADTIETEVTRAKEAEETLTSKITQTAEAISLKVSRGDVSNQLSVETDGISIKGNRFSWQSDYSSLTADGKLTVIDGFFSGSINAGDGIFTVDATTGKVVAKNIEIGSTSSVNTGYFSILIADSHTCNNLIVQEDAEIDNLTAGYISCNSSITCSKIYSSAAGEWWSDKRLKHDIYDIPLELAYDIVMDLRPVSYKMNDGEYPGVGFIAQEVKDICDKHNLAIPLYGELNGYYTIPYQNYIAILVGAIQYLNNKGGTKCAGD